MVRAKGGKLGGFMQEGKQWHWRGRCTVPLEEGLSLAPAEATEMVADEPTEAAVGGRLRTCSCSAADILLLLLWDATAPPALEFLPTRTSPTLDAPPLLSPRVGGAGAVLGGNSWPRVADLSAGDVVGYEVRGLTAVFLSLFCCCCCCCGCFCWKICLAAGERGKVALELASIELCLGGGGTGGSTARNQEEACMDQVNKILPTLFQKEQKWHTPKSNVIQLKSKL